MLLHSWATPRESSFITPRRYIPNRPTYSDHSHIPHLVTMPSTTTPWSACALLLIFYRHQRAAQRFSHDSTSDNDQTKRVETCLRSYTFVIYVVGYSMVTWSLSMGLCVVLAINNRGTRDVKGVAFPKEVTSRLERWWWTRLCCCCCCFVILEMLYNIMFLWLFVGCAKLLVHNGFMWTNKHTEWDHYDG